MFILKRLSCNNLTFVIVCAAFFTLFQNIAFFSKTTHLLGMSSLMDYVLVSSFFVFIFCFINILFSIILVSYIRKPIIILFLFCSAFANYFSYFYGIYIDKDMIQNLAQTNIGEAGALITIKLIVWIFIFAVLPSIWVILVKDNKRFSLFKTVGYRFLNIVISLVVLLSVSYPLYNQYAFFLREKTNAQFTKFITPSNYIQSVISYVKGEYLKSIPFVHIGEDAALQEVPGQKKKIMIVIVGETSRAMNFSLNGYEKETNPLLQKQSIINFTNARSCGTATAVSVPCMFSVMPREDYEGAQAERQDNLLDILQRASVNILWKENDSSCKDVCDRVPTIKLDEVLPKEKCPGGLCDDIELLNGLDQYIANLKGNAVIVLHTNGSHGPAYYQRYQKAQEKFTPACSTNAVDTCTQEELVNAYDNTIVNVDYVVNSVIELLKQHSKQYSTAMIYLSDHGESLGENGIYLHGITPYALAPKEQTHIPMILWLSKDFAQDKKIDNDCLMAYAKDNQVSHDNLFHTVLGGMNVTTTLYDPKLDLFRRCEK
ncbi:phosphoethanolamine transferase EptA [Gammaproteobacteria bacterium ESL0073]|nr:phosphoethanolamine transferase EptA [Gammaproteobacteria bacterium ESL0073]